MNINTIGRCILGLYTVGFISEKGLINKKPPKIELDNTKVEIHVCTLNEENNIKETLLSLNNQDKVDSGEVDIVLVDSNSDDGTKTIAKPFVDKIVNTPRGKLTSRDMTLKKSNCDIIAYADAGDIYPKGWLNKLLCPFRRSDVVAVGGFSHTLGRLNKPIGVLNNINNMVNNVLMGRNSALRRDAYLECGGFDLSIDEANLHEVWFEEEFKLPEKMSEVGEVVVKPSASCLYVDRRTPIINNASNKFKRQRKSGKRF